MFFRDVMGFQACRRISLDVLFPLWRRLDAMIRSCTQFVLCCSDIFRSLDNE
jgi:hypothetical protein